jgi:hypothetical protein
MDDSLQEAFLSTAYWVSIDTVIWSTIRINLRPQPELAGVIGARPWGFITAWNPQARRRAPAENAAAQRELLDALRSLPGVAVYPAIGVGTSGWSEPSLFAVGADGATLDALARQHGQLAYVHGVADGPAELRLLNSTQT